MHGKKMETIGADCELIFSRRRRFRCNASKPACSVVILAERPPAILNRPLISLDLRGFKAQPHRRKALIKRLKALSRLADARDSKRRDARARQRTTAANP